jgi:DNA polymerase III alpha subunit
MRLDRFSNPIFDESDIFDALYQGHQLSDDIIVDATDDLRNLETTAEIKFLSPFDDPEISIEQYDATMHSAWNMPDDYKAFDLPSFLYSKCSTPEQHARVTEELEQFVAHNMYDLLLYLKYMVDTMTENNVVWGVGRGSSVASYILFLMDVHSIDSMKYNLDWREFLR